MKAKYSKYADDLGIDNMFFLVILRKETYGLRCNLCMETLKVSGHQFVIL